MSHAQNERTVDEAECQMPLKGKDIWDFHAVWIGLLMLCVRPKPRYTA